MALSYINKVSSNRSDFEKKVNQIASRLGIKADWLMIVMFAESGLNHLAKNSNSTAVGLIQFLDSTLKNLGTNRNYLLSLTNVQQLDYVEKYFFSLGLKGKMKSVYDVYFAVFSPKYVGSSDSKIIAVLGSNIYNSNKALDINKDGKISVSDVKKWFSKFIPLGVEQVNNTKETPILIITTISILYLLYRWKTNKNMKKNSLLSVA